MAGDVRAEQLQQRGSSGSVGKRGGLAQRFRSFAFHVSDATMSDAAGNDGDEQARLAALRRCSTVEWPQALRAAAQVEMMVLELPERVAAHVLGADAATLAVPASRWPSTFHPSQQDRTDYDEDDDGGGVGEGAEEAVCDEFPEWDAAVDAAIVRLGGAVLPKLNWSAPKDATWMSADGTLCCTSAAEAVLLLRASDFAAADIEQARAMQLAPALVLKAWRPMAPASELRCFVLHGTLVAICQRHIHEVFPSLAASAEHLARVVARFVAGLAAQNALPCTDCVVDVYVDGGGPDAVSLVDVAPLDKAFLESAPSLVTWSELQQQQQCPPTTVRTVDAKALRGVQPGPRNLCGVPVDLRDATSAADLEEVINAMERETHKAASSAAAAAATSVDLSRH